MDDMAKALSPGEKEQVSHPEHYGGRDNVYEAIKVIDAWKVSFCLGNTLKYIARAGKKGAALQDLKKAAWYLQYEIENLEADVNKKGKGISNTP